MLNGDQREKYSRQILFAAIGEAGQEKLARARARCWWAAARWELVSQTSVRAGVGRLRIIDRDFVEPSNLQRQTLFEEATPAKRCPKQSAAERRLRAINSAMRRGRDRCGPDAAELRDELLDGFQLILDGTDNFETRLLINDAADLSAMYPGFTQPCSAATASR